MDCVSIESNPDTHSFVPGGFITKITLFPYGIDGVLVVRLGDERYSRIITTVYLNLMETKE